jgi:hypothetical protein
LTDDQVEKLTVGDRIKLGALTGTIVQAGALFVAMDLPELYTRAAMGQASLYMGWTLVEQAVPSCAAPPRTG